MSNDATHPPQVTAQEAQALIVGGAVLLDVREPDEWQAGHAPEAVHIPLGHLTQELNALDRDRAVLIICRSGVRSDTAAAFLQDVGFDARNVVGGMHAWQQAGGIVLSSTGQPGSVI